jgi:GTPase SAR1 family protein
VIFNVFTVAGAPTQRQRRQIVSREADGILFVVDSSRERLGENIESLRELKETFGDRLGTEAPLITMLNKRDLPNAMGRGEMIEALSLEKYQVYETISVLGIGLLQTFKALIRTLITQHLQGAAS